jgi:hypothetical protein
MTWVTWHQHRREALISLVFLAAIAIVLVYSGLQMRAFATTINLSVCTGTGAATSTCGIAMQQFLSAFAPIGIFILQMLAVVPGLVGVFIGAPLLARELEQGTHLLAWTQTITRTRWLVIKLALVGAAAIVAGLAAAQLASWWWAPLAVGFSSGDWQAFEAIGVSPAAYGISPSAWEWPLARSSAGQSQRCSSPRSASPPRASPWPTGCDRFTCHR